jgi:hypothetical protein
MFIAKAKNLFLLATILLFLPTINFLLNPNCNIFDNYLFCTAPTQLEKTLNFIYLLVIFLALSVSYFYIINSRTHLKKLFIPLVAFLFFLTVPFSTTDIFYYRGVAKGEVINTINPYKGGFEKDISLIKLDASPMDKPVMYPPGFLQLNKQIFKISVYNEFLSLYVYKLFGLITFLLTYLIIKKFNNVQNAILFALNPLFLFEFITAAHLDVYFIFFITISILLLIKNKAYLSIYSIFAAALIKFNAVLVLPFYILFKAFSYKRFIKKFYSLLISALVCTLGFLTIALFYKPYWLGPKTLHGISLQADWPFNSIFERVVFTKLNPYLYIFNGKYNAQSFRDFWLFLVMVGGIILLTHIMLNIKVKSNFKKLVKLNFGVTLNSVLFYSGLLMFIFPIFGLRYFLPWYLTWSAIYFIFADFKHKNKVLFIQTLILAIFYPTVFLLGHFTMGINNTATNNIRFIFELTLFAICFYYLFKSKVKILK